MKRPSTDDKVIMHPIFSPQLKKRKTKPSSSSSVGSKYATNTVLLEKNVVASNNSTVSALKTTGNAGVEFDVEAKWKEILEDEIKKKYFINLWTFIESELKAKQVLYPPMSEVYSAFNLCPFDKVKVVILGQDPYHGPGQAHGLAFSVQKGIPQPPSLKNMIKLAVKDVQIKNPSHGSLISWAKQGVFLVNTVLTVRHKSANSHKERGWERFTGEAVRAIAEKKKNVVFMLWGKPAEKKAKFVNPKDHLVLTAAHPSPLSSYRGYFDCAHYSKANEYLVKHGLEPIDWNL